MFELFLLSLILAGTYFIWCGYLDISHWKEARKMREISCWYCGNVIDKKNRTVYKKMDDEDLKHWFCNERCWKEYVAEKTARFD